MSTTNGWWNVEHHHICMMYDFVDANNSIGYITIVTKNLHQDVNQQQ